MDKAFTKVLKDNGFGDLDPITGPGNNPNFLNEVWQVSAFLNAANAHENPWVDRPYEAAKFADPRLDPDSDQFEGRR